MAKQVFTSDPPASFYEKILSCEHLDAVQDDILTPLVEALGASSAVFLQMFASPLGERHYGARSYVGTRPGSVDAYLDKFDGLDPVMMPALRWLDNPGQAAPHLLTGTFERNMELNSYYADSFLRPFDIGHVVAFVVPVNTGFETQMACVGLHRGIGSSAFSPQQIRWFQRLGPAIRSVLYVLSCREALVLSETVAMAAKEAGADMGFLILDEDLVVRNGNARGLEDMGMSSAGRIASPLLGEIKQRLLQTGVENTHFRFRADDERDCDVDVRDFRTTDGRRFHLVTTSGSGKRHAIGAACRSFGLTERETEIASRIAEGKCNASLAQELGISLRTGENHLRAIYRKVGVSSRTQLLSRLLQIQ